MDYALNDNGSRGVTSVTFAREPRMEFGCISMVEVIFIESTQ